MKSWKTTVCGLCSVLFVTLGLVPEMPPLAAKIFTALSPFLTGLGLMFARDNGVTSSQVLGTDPLPTRDEIIKAIASGDTKFLVKQAVTEATKP